MIKITSVMLLFYFLIVGQDSLCFSKVLVINDKFHGQLVGSYLEEFVDKSGTLSFEDIQKQNFIENSVTVPIHGYTDSVIWYKFKIRNELELNQTLFLELGVGWIDQFSIFQQEDYGQWQSKHIGTSFPLKNRIVGNNFPTHSITINSNSEKIFYLRLASSDALVFPLVLRSERQFRDYIRKKEILYGIFVGLMLLGGFYGLTFYVFSFSRAYLIYAFNAVSWLLMFTTFDGYIREIFEIDNYTSNKILNVLTSCFSMGLGTWFCVELLEIKKFSSRLYKISLFWILIVILVGLGGFVFPYQIMMIIAATLGMFFPILLLANGFSMYRAGVGVAKFYLCSWIFPAIGVIIFSASLLSWFPSNPYSSYFLHMGIFCEVICLSLTLSYHLRLATRNASVLKIGMEAAGLVHSSLMTNELPTENFSTAFRYLPCEETGGDLICCMADPRGDAVFLAIADISGHGLSSAMISSAFAGAFNSSIKGLKYRNQNLKQSCLEILENVNSVMADYFPRVQHFATMGLVGINIDTGEANYINAGHRNIFLKSKGTVKPIIVPGSLLGIQRSAIFNPHSFKMSEGDALLMYTDGLLENNLGPFGLYKIDTIIKHFKLHEDPSEIIDHIWKPIDKISQKIEFEDDMSILVVKLLNLRTKDQTDI